MKENWFHTCLDTNAFILNDDVKEALKYVDHVLPDIKWITPKLHEKVTWTSNMTSLDFIRYIDEQWMNYWIRYVVVPWLTDNEIDIKNLWEFIKTLKHFTKINLLPYHTMALEKREQLWWDYPLKWVPAATKEDIQKVKDILKEYIDENTIE